MRIRRMTTVLLLTAALTGCAEMTATPDVTAATSEAAGDEAIAEATPLPIGNYLAARFAASEHDMPEAAKYYRAALNEDPGNTDLLSSAFIYSAYAGDVDGAARLAQQIITASPSDRTARLVLSLAAFKRRNFTEARKQLSLAQPGSFMALTGALIDGWAAVGLRDATAAETNMKTLAAQNGGSPMSALHRALMLDAMGRTGTEMNDAYLQALAQNPANSRLIDAYGRYLEREGRGQEAAALYTRLGNNAGITPIAAAGRARVAAGRKPDKLVRNAEDGVAEALAGIASALSDPDSVDASMFYLRLALYLRPDHDFASIILGARFETLKKYEDANVAYGRIRK